MSSAKCREWTKKNFLTILIVTSVVLGIVVGVVIRIGFNFWILPTNAEYLGSPGSLLIRSLKLAAIPFIVCAIIVALGSMNTHIIATLGWQILLWIIVTKFITVSICILMTVIIKPGKRGEVQRPAEAKVEAASVIPDIFLDLIRNIIPNNMVEIYLRKYQTKLVPPGDRDTNDYYAWRPEPGFQNSMNLLGSIFISIVIGIALSLARGRGRVFLVLMSEVYQLTRLLITLILWAAPLPLFFLILAEILKISDFSVYASTWGYYVITNIVCHAIMILVVFPTYLLVFARCNPFRLYADIVQAIATAIATASSLVCMPLLMRGLERNGVDKRLTRFVIPILVNSNKDGTCVLLSVGVVAIAQMLGEDLSIGTYFSIILLCVLGSMATAAVPFAGLVVLILILNGLGIDQSLTSTIMALYWILDRIDTVDNEIGNAVATKILYTWNKNLIATLEEKELKDKSRDS